MGYCKRLVPSVLVVYTCVFCLSRIQTLLNFTTYLADKYGTGHTKVTVVIDLSQCNFYERMCQLQEPSIMEHSERYELQWMVRPVLNLKTSPLGPDLFGTQEEECVFSDRICFQSFLVFHATS